VDRIGDHRRGEHILDRDRLAPEDRLRILLRVVALVDEATPYSAMYRLATIAKEGVAATSP
jgi:hypothetical protein